MPTPLSGNSRLERRQSLGGVQCFDCAVEVIPSRWGLLHKGGIFILNWDSCMENVFVGHEMSDGEKSGEPV